jgi:multiple sugar transport system ATP-binding protein
MTITLTGVTKQFGAFKAVDNVSLSAGERDFIVLLGPSGSGKSTLLRMIAGLEDVSSGTIEIGGRRVDQMEPVERNIAFVFQTYALYPHMTVRRNIAFPLIMQRARGWHHLPFIGSIFKRRIERMPEVRERVESVARSIGLDEMLERHPRTLSGGQRQRVAVGRALVRNPTIFLMDEPLSNLDAQLRVEMRAQITRLFGQLGKTFVYVTHDQVEAMTMATLVVVLDHGQVQQIGTPREIYEHPANEFVARFIGNPPMNIFVGRRRGDRIAIDDGGPVLALPEHVRRQTADGAVLHVGARPEDILVTPGSSGSGTAATVSAIERLGPETLVGIVFGENWQRRYGETSVEDFARLGGYSTLKPGDRIEVRFNEDRLSFFSPETGQSYSAPVTIQSATAEALP